MTFLIPTQRARPVNIAKNQIQRVPHSQGQRGRATQADQERPDRVDIADDDDHTNLLQELGVNPVDRIGRLTGGGGGGAGGELGGMLGEVLCCSF